MVRALWIIPFAFAACSSPAEPTPKQIDPIAGVYAAEWAFEMANANGGLGQGTLKDTLYISTKGDTVIVSESGYRYSPQKSGEAVRSKAEGANPYIGDYRPETRSILGSKAIREIQFDEQFNKAWNASETGRIYHKVK